MKKKSNSKIAEIYKNYKEAIKPKQTLSIADWGKAYCPAIDSAVGSKADISLTPWFREPLQNALDPDTKEINILTSVGMGKTLSFFELLPSYLIACDGGPMLLIQSTETESQLHYETRLLPSLKLNPEIVPLLPKGRHKIKKGAVYFPHMMLLMDGANITSLQSKSIRYAFGDEAWIWKDGLINELRRRTHDRHNSLMILISQGGFTNTEWHNATQNGEIFDYSFNCPHCQELQPYKFTNIKWDQSAKLDNNDYDWAIIEQSTYYECEHCKQRIEDKPLIRRAMADNGTYVSRNNNHVSGIKTYVSNSLCNYRVKWSTLVIEWLKAIQSKRKGNPQPWIQFKQKRLAEFCKVLDSMIQDAPLTLGGYSKQDYANGELMDNEKHRIMSVDVQGHDEFWTAIRAFDINGNSKLIYEGKRVTWADLDALQAKYKVNAQSVVVDAGWNTEVVQSECAKRKWIWLNGTSANSYSHDTKNGKKIHRIYSGHMAVDTANGKSFGFYFSTAKAKDLFAALKAGRLSKWECPNDVSELYRKHLSQWYQTDSVNSKTKNKVLIWATASNDEHLADCELMIMVCAILHGIKFIGNATPDLTTDNN